MKRKLAVRSAGVLVCTLAFAATSWGNGEMFFMPARSGRPVDLVYVGRIKDKQTGRAIEGVSITITDKRSGLLFPFENNSPGHYRSPDVGAAIKDLAGTKLDAGELQFEVTAMGYKPVTLTKVPRKTNGIVEVNFKLEPESSNASGAPTEDSPGDSTGRLWFWIALGGAVAIATTGVARRALVRPQSTAR